MTVTTIGAGSEKLALAISEDAYGGDAQFTVGVDGQQVGDTLTASSLHNSGQSDVVNVLGDWASGPHTVTVNFLNDAYDGTPATDRNLYVDGAAYDGAPVDGAARALYPAGPASFGFTASPPLQSVAGPVTVGSGSDTLALQVSEDAYKGDAQFTVAVDGQQVGGVLTATAEHGGGASNAVNVLGNWAAGPHTVTVNFLNDAYDGTADTDRNLYVDGATYDGKAVGGASLSLLSSGPQSFSLADPGSTFTWPDPSTGSATPQPQPNPGDTLVLTGGTFTAPGGLPGVTVYLNGTTPAAPATLAVQGGSVGALKLISLSNPVRYASYGNLAVSGNVTVESPLQWGGRSISSQSLTVTMGSADTLNLNGGSLQDAASLVVNGSAGSTVTNTGTLTLLNTGQFAIHADLAGAGTIQSVPAAASSGVNIELDGAVAAGQTVRLDGGTLQLDQPMRFMGTVSGMTTSSPGGPASRLALEHTTVTGTSFQQGANNAGTLSVFTQDPNTGAAGTDVIHVAGSFAPDAFVFTSDLATQSALIRVAPLPQPGA